MRFVKINLNVENVSELTYVCFCRIITYEENKALGRNQFDFKVLVDRRALKVEVIEFLEKKEHPFEF